MGLTLHYELRLPSSTTRVDARRILTDLRVFAESMDFAEVSPIVEVGGENEGVEIRWVATAEFWSERSATLLEMDEDDRRERDEAADDDQSSHITPIREVLFGDPASALVFFVHPGEGCELASFGFLERPSQDGGARELYWDCHCKTQYASNVSEGHFIACHTKIVRMLDKALALGVEVVVNDEGFYWETRNEARLIAELRTMNHIVARFAGVLSDRLGDAHQIEAAIFTHPRFERLEMGE